MCFICIFIMHLTYKVYKHGNCLSVLLLKAPASPIKDFFLSSLTFFQEKRGGRSSVEKDSSWTSNPLIWIIVGCEVRK
jgi:hypothetical protein